MKSKAILASLGFCALALSLVGNASAATVRTNAGFRTNTLLGNDDGSTGLVSIGFNAIFSALPTVNSTLTTTAM